METFFDNPDGVDARTRTLYVRNEVAFYGAELRRRHPWLFHQDAIGAGIMALALACMLCSAALYIAGHMAWWVCVLLNAFFASFIHELEHDLIHDIYFRKQRVLQHIMLALAWLARPSTINPWVRRPHHINHHKFSGTEKDIEERTLSNGTRWGLLRLLMIGDLMVSTMVMIGREKDPAKRHVLLKEGFRAYLPLTAINWSAWYVFLAFHGANAVAGLVGAPIHWSMTTLAIMQVIDIAVVVLVGPNILRTFCLHFITSNIHYYGDIDTNNVVEQVQVLNPWWLWPMQLFCCNFGGTHVIHHFLVNEPFYIRQMSAPVAYRVMREMGVRFNDYGTFMRANRLHSPSWE